MIKSINPLLKHERQSKMKGGRHKRTSDSRGFPTAYMKTVTTDPFRGSEQEVEATDEQIFVPVRSQPAQADLLSGAVARVVTRIAQDHNPLVYDWFAETQSFMFLDLDGPIILTFDPGEEGLDDISAMLIMADLFGEVDLSAMHLDHGSAVIDGVFERL